MATKHWKGMELGTHNYSDQPHYNVHMNGKVDINPQSGTANHKIELRVNGMYRLVKDWFASGHMLSDEDRASLIDLIATKGNRIYNTKTKEWEEKE